MKPSLRRPMHSFREYIRIEKTVDAGAPLRAITAQDDCRLSRAAVHRWRDVLRDAGGVLTFPGDRGTVEFSQDDQRLEAPAPVEADQTTFVETERETTQGERSETKSETASEQYAHARALNEFAEIPVELDEGKSCAREDRLSAFEQRVRDFDLEVVFADLMEPLRTHLD